MIIPKSTDFCICNLVFVLAAVSMDKCKRHSRQIVTSRDGGKSEWVCIEDKVVCVMDCDVVLEALVQIEHHIVFVEQRSQPLGNLWKK